MPAHWCVELCVVPLVDRATSRGVFRSGCELSTTLGSLSADGWGCVPPLLVVWPEASQHWSLQAVGWSQVSVPKWPPLGQLVPINMLWGLHLQSPCARSAPQPTHTSPGDPPHHTGWSSPGSCGVTALFWVPVYVKSCVHPPRVQFLFLPVLWSSCTQALLAFKAKCSGGSSF